MLKKNNFEEKFFKQKKQEKIKNELLANGCGHFLIIPFNEGDDDKEADYSSRFFRVSRTHVTFCVLNWEELFDDAEVEDFSEGFHAFVELKYVQPETLSENSPFVGGVVLDDLFEDDYLM